MVYGRAPQQFQRFSYFLPCAAYHQRGKTLGDHSEQGNKKSSGGGEKEGVFFIDLNYNAISALCDENITGNQGYAFILDQEGNIVYHPQQQQLYNELQTENIDLIMDTDSDTVLTGNGNSGKLYSISRSEKQDGR